MHECPSPVDSYPMDKLYAKLSEQHSIMQQQKEMQKAAEDDAQYARGFDPLSSCSSVPLTPATEILSVPASATARCASAAPGEGQLPSDEVLRLKLELAQAQNKISRLDHELAHTRIGNAESESATPALVSEPDYSSIMAPSVSPVAPRLNVGGLVLNAPSKMPAFSSREPSWITQDEPPAEMGDPLPSTALSRPRGIWNNSNSNKSTFGGPFPQQSQMMMDGGGHPAPWGANNRVASYEPTFVPPGMDPYRQDRMAPDQDVMRPMGRRGNRYDNRYGPSNSFGGGFNNNYMSPTPYEMAQGYSNGPHSMMGGGMGMGVYSPYQQQPVGTALSPHATEFTSIASWKNEVSRRACLVILGARR